MSTPLSEQERDRVTPTVAISLVIASILAGVWVVTGTAITWFPALAVPAAVGLPDLIPALRMTPLGGTTWLFWVVDIVTALVMVAVAVLHTRAAHARHPSASRGRVFGRALLATVWGVLAGNILRGVFLSVVTHAGFGMFLGLLGANVLVSAVTGAVLGVVIGAVAAAVARSQLQQPSSR